jgi:hypothetical protein
MHVSVIGNDFYLPLYLKDAVRAVWDGIRIKKIRGLDSKSAEYDQRKHVINYSD